jgi:dinuclear metal center YbgI/SA1388 family protein
MDIDELAKIDASLNGVQVGHLESEINRAAFAVDACMESVRRAVEAKADVLFVHHGMFWGPGIPITGVHYDRVAFLVENRCGLYASHLPLDRHPEFGNNAGLAAALSITDQEAFGDYHGVKIGLKGTLNPPLSINEVLEKLTIDRNTCGAVLPFGKEVNESIGIVSGGATREINQAVEEGLDLYLTGEASHTMYHFCLEESINLIAGGHYQTETVGVKLLADRLTADTGIETVFIDIPTGL